jgi:hypothetical protein
MKIGIAVYCMTCGLRKAPRGRSVPVAIANGMCDTHCSGFYENPRSGDLWPGETEEEFGFPVGNFGVAEMGG